MPPVTASTAPSKSPSIRRVPITSLGLRGIIGVIHCIDRAALANLFRGIVVVRLCFVPLRASNTARPNPLDRRRKLTS